jgi:glycosyltransferase involved in cell wall biosynthesis
MNRASAVAYLPFDEDSLGYVAMEAATAGKPIITTTDSGGILKLAMHGTTGLVAAPNPRALADAMNRINSHPSQAVTMGQAAREHWRQMGINWDKTLERLLA